MIRSLYPYTARSLQRHHSFPVIVGYSSQSVGIYNFLETSGKCALFKSKVENLRPPVFVFHLLCPAACAERRRNAEVASAQSALRELFVLRWACVPNCFQPPRTRLLLSSIRNKTRRCWCACSTACHSLEIKGEQDQVRHPNLNSQPCGSNSPLGRCLRRSYPLPCQHMLVRAVVKNVILRRTSP